MQRIKLVLEYDGTAYYGWQLQSGQHSVQAELENALKILFKRDIRVTAAGRTDAGVHARGQVVHFDAPQADLFRLKRSLNGLMQRDVVVKRVEQAGADFHARFDATARRYRYYIQTEAVAINRQYCWTIFYPLNLTLMQVGAEMIMDYKDFKAFCKVKSEVNNHLVRMITSHWLKQHTLLIYEVQANRFLHGMVRALVGTLVELGRGRISLEQLQTLIESGDRTLVPATAPAKGLVLEEVSYE